MFGDLYKNLFLTQFGLKNLPWLLATYADAHCFFSTKDLASL